MCRQLGVIWFQPISEHSWSREDARASLRLAEHAYCAKELPDHKILHACIFLIDAAMETCPWAGAGVDI